MKTCVITGAASGIGAALAYTFARQGYRIIGLDRTANAAVEQTLKKAGAEVSFITADLATAEGLQRSLDSLVGETIDVLIHSAGINLAAPFASSDIDKQVAVVNVNLRAPLLLTRGLLTSKRLLQGATLVFISSLSHYVSYPGASVYAASKDGLTSYARSLSVALKPQGISVLTVFPGPTRTPHAAEHSPDNSRADKRMPPEVLAKKIFSALDKQQSSLIPGFALRLFATVGRWLPFVTERVMLKSLYEPLKARGSQN